MAHHGDTERRQPNTERSGNTALTLGARRQAAQKGNLPALQRGDSASGRRRKSERHSCRPRPTDTRVYRYFTPQFRLNDDQLVRLPEQQCHIKRRETAVRNEPARWLPFLLQLERGRRRPTGSIGRFRPTLRAHKQAGPARKEKQAGEKAAAAARASLLEPSGDGHGPAAMNAPSLQACSAHKRFINFFFFPFSCFVLSSPSCPPPPFPVPSLPSHCAKKGEGAGGEINGCCSRSPAYSADRGIKAHALSPMAEGRTKRTGTLRRVRRTAAPRGVGSFCKHPSFPGQPCRLFLSGRARQWRKRHARAHSRAEQTSLDEEAQAKRKEHAVFTYSRENYAHWRFATGEAHTP